MNKPRRGSGFRYTLPAVFRFSAVWVIVVVLIAPVVVVSMMLGGLIPEALHGDIRFFLLTRTPLIALVAVGIAIFTTNRLAGPWIHLTRALKQVERGDLDYRLKFRKEDRYLREVEVSFNSMMAALSGQAVSSGGPDAGD